MITDIKSQLLRDEGIRLFPYTDTVGKLTIGIGRNLTDKGISSDEAMSLLDRLAREFRIQEELLLYLMRHSLTLIAADTGENITEAMLADPMRRFVVQLQGLLAELDKNLTVAKLRKARASKRAKGGFSGGNMPYGYVPEKATEAQIMRANQERSTARRIRYLRNHGVSLKAIRATLAHDGIRPRNGGQWQLSTIRAIAQGETKATSRAMAGNGSYQRYAK